MLREWRALLDQNGGASVTRFVDVEVERAGGVVSGAEECADAYSSTCSPAVATGCWCSAPGEISTPDPIQQHRRMQPFILLAILYRCAGGPTIDASNVQRFSVCGTRR